MGLGVTLGECPFCGGEVDEDIVTFGGSCPKCFAEIPGEEAATDPGEDVKQAQDRADNRRSTVKALIPVVLALPFIFALGCAAIWLVLLRPAPEVALLNFDDFEGYTLPDVVAAEPGDEEEPKLASNTAQPRPRSGSDAASKYSKGSDVEFEAGTADLGGDGVASADRGPRGTRGGVDGPEDNVAIGGGVDGSRGTSGGLDLNMDVGASRRGGVLTDPAQIKTMIHERMVAQNGRLQQCYEQELKRDSSVAGKWRIRFTVKPDGKAAEVSATGITTKVPSFEACLTREVTKWRFQRLKNQQAVQRTWTFRK